MLSDPASSHAGAPRWSVVDQGSRITAEPVTTPSRPIAGRVVDEGTTEPHPPGGQLRVGGSDMTAPCWCGRKFGPITPADVRAGRTWHCRSWRCTVAERSAA